MPLMPQIRPPTINLSLKCQHVKSSRMSAWAHYVAFVKKYLNSRWSKSASKEIYLTSIPPIFCLFDTVFCLSPHCEPGPRLHVKVLLQKFHLNGHTTWFRIQIQKLEQITDANLSFKKLLSKCKPQLVMKGDCLIRFKRERQKDRESLQDSGEKENNRKFKRYVI